MTLETLDLFEASPATERPTSRAKLTRDLMSRLAEKGLTLEQLCDPKIMERSPATLKRYARRFGIAFPDYVPRSMRAKTDAS